MEENQVVKYTMSEMIEVSPTPFLNLFDVRETKCYTPKDGSPYLVYECEPANRFFQYCPDCNNRAVAVHGYLPQPRLQF